VRKTTAKTTTTRRTCETTRSTEDAKKNKPTYVASRAERSSRGRILTQCLVNACITHFRRKTDDEERRENTRRGKPSSYMLVLTQLTPVPTPSRATQHNNLFQTQNPPILCSCQLNHPSIKTIHLLLSGRWYHVPAHMCHRQMLPHWATEVGRRGRYGGIRNVLDVKHRCYAPEFPIGVLLVWVLAEFLYITRAAARRRSVRNNLFHVLVSVSLSPRPRPHAARRSLRATPDPPVTIGVLKPPNGMGKWNGLRESICMGWLEDPEWVAKRMVARNAESRTAESRNAEPRNAESWNRWRE